MRRTPLTAMLTLAAVLASSLGLAACGGKSGGSSSTQTTSTAPASTTPTSTTTTSHKHKSKPAY